MLAQIKRRPKRAPRKQRITQLTLDKKRRPPKAFLTWDTKAPNLALRTQPTGFKSWAVIYSRSGRPRWLTLGPVKSIPLEEARIMAAEAMLKVAKGGDPAAEKRAGRSADSFSDLASKYVEQYAKKHNKSWKQPDNLIRRYALPRLGKLVATSITRNDIKAMLAKIAAPALANQVLAACSPVFTWGIKEGLATANPCKLIDRNPTRDRERVLSDSEVPLFWKAFGDLDPVRGAALRAILLLGQRPGKIASMRREHIVDGWWQMPGEPVGDMWPGTKNGKDHRVWLPAPVRNLLAELHDDDATSGYIFAGPHGGPTTKLDAEMRAICAKLKIEPPVRPHDLRRSHGTMITRLDFGRDAMNRVQNHVEGGVTDTYDRYKYETENKRVMESVAAKIMALAEGREADNLVRPSFGRPTTGS